LYLLVASVYRYVPIRAITVPILVLSVNLLPKNTTEVPMMTTLFTTLHTPCDTGVTRDNVLKANCRQGWHKHQVHIFVCKAVAAVSHKQHWSDVTLVLTQQLHVCHAQFCWKLWKEQQSTVIISRCTCHICHQANVKSAQDRKV